MKIITFIKKHAEIAILLVTGLATHLFMFDFPHEAVFDEVYFTSFISNYFTHNYFFDIHPPLGKLLIAGIGYLTGFTPLSHELVIGEALGTTSFFWLRLLPVIAGIVLPLIIYRLCRELKLSKLASLFTGLLIVFESSLLVQSRFVLLDSLLLAFGFFGFLLYFIYRRTDKIWQLLLSVTFLTFSFSIKWTGASFFAIIVILEIINLIRLRKNAFSFIRSACIFFVLPSLIYFSIFAIHLSILYKSGPGDPFMSKSFQKTLVGNPNENVETEPLTLGEKAAELNFEMYRSNKRLTAEHSYGSKWYTWPIMKRPIYYWHQKTSTTTDEHIYLFGNPFIYWISTIAILLSMILFIFSFFDKSIVYNRKLGGFLIFAYLFNILPFIGITRVMFLYHYFTALIIAIITLAFLIDSMSDQRLKKRFFLSLLIISILFFLYFSPLIYGLPINATGEHLLFWFKTWR